MSKQYQSIRIFKSPILEACTHVHPVVPLILWIPIILFWIYQAISINQLSLAQLAGISVIAILSWTLVEYLMHRFVFHMKGESKLVKRFVFLFHGLHHDDPQDPTRLVMPPVPAILLASIIYFLFSLIIPSAYMKAFMAFFMIGYLCYDYIHFGTHHFAMTSKVGRYLKKFHLQHHHQHEPTKYGVSSPLWDYIFGTAFSKAEVERKKCRS